MCEAMRSYIDQMLDPNDNSMKVLLFDNETLEMSSLVYSRRRLLERKVYLHDTLASTRRQKKAFLTGIVFVRPTATNVQLLKHELENPKCVLVAFVLRSCCVCVAFVLRSCCVRVAFVSSAFLLARFSRGYMTGCSTNSTQHTGIDCCVLFDRYKQYRIYFSNCVSDSDLEVCFKHACQARMSSTHVKHASHASTSCKHLMQAPFCCVLGNFFLCSSAGAGGFGHARGGEVCPGVLRRLLRHRPTLLHLQPAAQPTLDS